jgi:hypothetical protein
MSRSEEREEQVHVPGRARLSLQARNPIRKRLIGRIQDHGPHSEPLCLQLDKAALVEVGSEDPRHPIEGALVRGDKRGWRAAEAGTQLIRLIFHRPQTIERIELEFNENDAARTQEFVLRWMPIMGLPREIVRQK